MSRLEEKAKPALEQIIRVGNPVSLLPESVKSVAVFAFKGAVVADYLNVGEEPFFSASIRSRFRESLEIPAEVQMWIASYCGGQLRGDFKRFRFRTHLEALADAEFYVFTYVIGYLVLQVLAERWWQNPWGHENLPILSPDRVWEPAVIRFWPNAGAPIMWPPHQDLSEDSLNVFSERWQAPIAHRTD